jgi:hypothetical protein
MDTPRPPRLVLVLALCGALLAAAPAAEARTPQKIAGCPVFPATNVWNKRIDHLPVHPNSARIART